MDIDKVSRTFRAARRVQQIINVFLRHGFGRVIDQIRLNRYIPLSMRLKSFGQLPSYKGADMARQLRLSFEELGPSFIKLGQILSARPDLIGTEFSDEFKKLQDEVPPFPSAQAQAIIEDELKRPMNEIFRGFDGVPIAAASIAQVHKAVLMDGSDVVVKVQRPDIKELIELDISILGMFARLMERNMPEARFFNPIGIIDEFAKTIRKELDFVQEAKNCLRFTQNFAANPDVYFPRIYPHLLTEKVFVMEHIHGIRIDRVEELQREGYDRKRIAQIGVEAYFKMVFEDGFFHADPHPGNLFVTVSGEIAFVDFGIVGRVSDELKQTMANTFLALINKDFDRLIDGYIELGLVPDETDLDTFKRNFKMDLMEILDPLYGLTISQINFPEFLNTFMNLAIKHSMRIPAPLLLIDKAMLILQNIGLQLDPDFDFIAASEPYASKLLRERYSPLNMAARISREARDFADFSFGFPRQVRKILRKIEKNDLHLKLHHKELEPLIKDIDKTGNRLAFSMVISALIVGSAILHSSGAAPRIFGVSVFGFLGFAFAGFMGIWLLISILRSGRL